MEEFVSSLHPHGGASVICHHLPLSHAEALFARARLMTQMLGHCLPAMLSNSAQVIFVECDTDDFLEQEAFHRSWSGELVDVPDRVLSEMGWEDDPAPVLFLAETPDGGPFVGCDFISGWWNLGTEQLFVLQGSTD